MTRQHSASIVAALGQSPFSGAGVSFSHLHEPSELQGRWPPAQVWVWAPGRGSVCWDSARDTPARGPRPQPVFTWLRGELPPSCCRTLRLSQPTV